MYNLPKEKIAQFPAKPRDSSKLLVINRNSDLKKTVFNRLPEYLNKDDLLVINDVKVIPARLYGKKSTGANVEILLLENLEDRIWKTLVKPGKRLPLGAIINFSENLSAEVIDLLPEGERILKFSMSKSEFFEELNKLGHMPLPPYINRPDIETDRTSYQTIYADKVGAIAAPTAGLHFTQQLLNRIKGKGVEIVRITLNVGWGTFKPIKTPDIRDHVMHREFYEINSNTADAINNVKKEYRRVIGVGTTTVRALESVAKISVPLKAQRGWSDIYIYPGFEFKVVDVMITNFHLPGSSLLVMVSAFAGNEIIQKAYRYAIDKNFRFFSYGDAMLLEKQTTKK
jgi:S-adenosylmethionine:tRNA ribosyltransferase-isomerase